MEMDMRLRSKDGQIAHHVLYITLLFIFTCDFRITTIATARYISDLHRSCESERISDL